SSGIGITRTALPSTIHSRDVRALMPSFRRMSAGIDTWPRSVTLVRITELVSCVERPYKQFSYTTCPDARDLRTSPLAVQLQGAAVDVTARAAEARGEG